MTEPDAAPGDRGIDGQPGFAPYDDVGQHGVARRIAPTYLYAGNVDVAADGAIRMWRPTLLDGPFDLDRVPVMANAIERYSPDGVLEDRRPIGDRQAVFHADGDITLRRPFEEGPTEYLRWTAAFDEVARVVVPRSAPIEQPTYYRVADDGGFTTEPAPPAVPRMANLVAGHDGGYYGVQMVGGTFGDSSYRLVRLDASYATTAATWLLPGAEMPIWWQGTPIETDDGVVTPILRYAFYNPQLLVDREDRVWVLTGAPGSAAAALEHWLGRPVDLRDTGDLFLLRFSATLELESVVALPAASRQTSPRIAEAADGTIGVVALSDQPREIAPNKTFDYNVFFAGIAPDGALLGQRELDIDHDEQPYALAACGPGFCVGGETATTWVDTGSQVTFAQGFIALFDTHANQLGLATLHGPRSNSIEALAARSDGSVVFSGTTDGPITHTGQNERERTPVLGSLRF